MNICFGWKILICIWGVKEALMRKLACMYMDVKLTMNPVVKGMNNYAFYNYNSFIR